MATPFADFPSRSSPVPSYRSTAGENDQHSLLAEEAVAALQTLQRSSRASSIASIRTKFSTNSAREDARSIDLNLDGTVFTIGRTGSRITTRDPPRTLPKYLQGLQTSGLPASIPLLPEDEPGDHSAIQRSGPQRPELDANSMSPAMPCNDFSELDRASPNLMDTVLAGVVHGRLSRYHSFKRGNNEVSLRKARRPSRGEAQTSTPIRRESSQAKARLSRRNGVLFPKLATDVLNTQTIGNFQNPAPIPSSIYSNLKRTKSGSSIPRSGDQPLVSRSAFSDFRSKRASDRFLSQPATSISGLISPSADHRSTVAGHGPADTGTDDAESIVPFAMETQNDVAAHYSRLIRLIDHEHRKVLHERDQENAKLRERLNEQDIIYRQQLRARDFTIDDLKARVSYLETNSASDIERATNAVEDLWERRWKDRNFHLTERMGRMEADHQLAIERAAAEKDRIWQDASTNESSRWAERLENEVQALRCNLANSGADQPML